MAGQSGPVGGGPSYAELLKENEALRSQVAALAGVAGTWTEDGEIEVCQRCGNVVEGPLSVREQAEQPETGDLFDTCGICYKSRRPLRGKDGNPLPPLPLKTKKVPAKKGTVRLRSGININGIIYLGPVRVPHYVAQELWHAEHERLREFMGVLIGHTHPEMLLATLDGKGA